LTQIVADYYTEKNFLLKIDGDQNFLVKFIRILIEIIGISDDTIFLVKSIGILIYQNNYIRILIISTRILVDHSNSSIFRSELLIFPSVNMH